MRSGISRLKWQMGKIGKMLDFLVGNGISQMMLVRPVQSGGVGWNSEVGGNLFSREN